jgi:hypothetical protein
MADFCDFSYGNCRAISVNRLRVDSLAGFGAAGFQKDLRAVSIIFYSREFRWLSFSVAFLERSREPLHLLTLRADAPHRAMMRVGGLRIVTNAKA